MESTGTQVWMVLGAAFGASLLTTLGSRWVAGFQMKKQILRDSLQDQRELRNAKRDRLNEAYVPVLHAAIVLERVAKQMLVEWAEEPRERRDQRLNEDLIKAHESLDMAIVRLKLEEGTSLVLTVYENISSAWILHRHWARFLDHRSPSYGEAIKEIEEGLTAMRQGAADLEAAARNHLDSLERPL